MDALFAILSIIGALLLWVCNARKTGWILLLTGFLGLALCICSIFITKPAQKTIVLSMDKTRHCRITESVVFELPDNVRIVKDVTDYPWTTFNDSLVYRIVIKN